MKEKQSEKLYYSIGEVAKLFGVNESLLRFWEKEFDVIAPKNSANGVRYYKTADIEAVRLVYHLVKEKGLTLAGAKLKLKNNKEDTVKNEEVVHRLKTIRQELLEWQKAFEKA
jgi:DNA-binding transcriptional MerR regulator